MLSFLYRSKPHKSKKPSPRQSPSLSSIDDDIDIDENFDDFIQIDKITAELNTAKQEITSLLERKKLLEVQLLEKEKENKLLLEKISALTSDVEAEKIALLQQKKEFMKQEKTLENQIAFLRLELYEKEKQHRLLLEKVSGLESILQEITILQQKNKLQHDQFLEKEHEYQRLLAKTSELDIKKHEIEQALVQEKQDHQKTQDGLGIEKNLRLAKESECERLLKKILLLETAKHEIEQALAKEQFEHKKTQDLLKKEKDFRLTDELSVLDSPSTNQIESIPPVPRSSGISIFPYRNPEKNTKNKLFSYHSDSLGYNRYLW